MKRKEKKRKEKKDVLTMQAFHCGKKRIAF